MPKRVVDGLGVWRSDKLRRVEPVWVRTEFANLIPLALANGVFECDPERVWADVYSYNRPDIRLADVSTILDSFERFKLLFRWQVGEKIWGFWTGIEKPGRLPGKSRRGKNELAGPEPPEAELKAFLASVDANGIQKLLGSGSGKNICADQNRLHGAVSSSSTENPLELEALARVWAYYLEKLKKNPKLLTFTTLRQQKGLARFREALAKTKGDLARAEQLMRVAVDNLAASAFHVGQNDRGKRYDSWEKNLFGTTEQFERWLDVEG